MFSQLARIAVSRGFLAVVGLSLAASVARGQSIDQLFREYNDQMAAGSYTEAERTARRMVEAAPTQNWQAASHNALGRALNSQLRYGEAGPALEKALAIPLAAGNSNRGWIPNNLGHNYRKRKRFAEAEKLFEQARTEFTRIYGPKSEQVAIVRGNQGWLYYDQEQFDKAAQTHREVLALARELFGDEDTAVASSLSDLGMAQIGQGQFAESQKNLEQALAIKRRVLGSEAPDVAIILNNLATLYRKQGKFSQAESHAREALAIREKLFGRQSPVVAEMLTALAGDLREQGQDDKAKALTDEAASIKKLLASATAPSDNPFRVGQRIQVKAERASVMAGAASLGYAVKGMQFNITHIQGKWCGVRITVGSETKTGWLDASEITLAQVGKARLTPIALKHEVVSADGGFRILMPRPPVLTKETEAGIAHNAYTLETPQGRFVAAWFDVPEGSSLTFDAALEAFIAARDGKLETDDRVSLEDEFPGRDWLIRLPAGDYCRMRLLTVKTRNYQLIVEGPKELVTSKEADAYFNSFQRR
jgi:tetratricopeptide (TPR) repeat protein